jgi:hypothetical protein
MFARVKKSGHYQYLQIVENNRPGLKIAAAQLANETNVSQWNRTRTFLCIMAGKRLLSVVLVRSGRPDLSFPANTAF